MVRPDEFHNKTSHTHRIPKRNPVELCTLQKLMFGKFGFDEAERERGAIDRDVQLLEHIGERPDMIFVSVR